MTREEFKTLVKGMKAVYAQPTFIPDQDAFNVWFELLKDIPYQQAKYKLNAKDVYVRTRAEDIPKIFPGNDRGQQTV